MSGAEKKVQLINEELWSTLIRKAEESPRRRTNFNFHSSDSDLFHRFLNVILEGSYIAPHRHITPPKAEHFLVLKGEIAFFIFEEDGQVRELYRVSEGQGIDIPEGFWHSLVVLRGPAVCFEAKPGPYHPVSDKHFSPWAPLEGEEGAKEYLEKLKDIALTNLI